jgi:hypothetical protein
VFWFSRGVLKLLQEEEEEEERRRIGKVVEDHACVGLVEERKD